MIYNVSSERFLFVEIWQEEDTGGWKSWQVAGGTITVSDHLEEQSPLFNLNHKNDPQMFWKLHHVYIIFEVYISCLHKKKKHSSERVTLRRLIRQTFSSCIYDGLNLAGSKSSLETRIFFNPDCIQMNLL